MVLIIKQSSLLTFGISRDHRPLQSQIKGFNLMYKTITNTKHLLVVRQCSKYVHGLFHVILTMTTEAIFYFLNIYWAPKMCQTLVWMLGLLHWSKHIKMSAFSRLRSSVSRKHYSSIWIQEFWLLGYKVVIVISRCHEMQSLLDINQNLMNYKQLNVKQLGDICVFWLLPECCDWVINLVWYSMSWARNWKEVELELE